ncbi:CENPK protein, partial [Turnix velox]|nr:CENPK protein [Turnix velox]
LQKLKNDLEMLLLTVQVKSKHLKEDLKREEQWHEEQVQIVNALNELEGSIKTRVQQPHRNCAGGYREMENEMLKLRAYKEKLLNDLGEFLEEHFPLPETPRSAKKQNFPEEPDVELVTLNEILELLINELMNTPHEPYITINDSFWPPYIEMLLRYGIILRHPEDPSRVRLEAFHM